MLLRSPVRQRHDLLVLVDYIHTLQRTRSLSSEQAYSNGNVCTTVRDY